MKTLDDRRQQHVAHLEHELESIVEQLRAMEDVQKVILFGSWARNRRDLGSDLDLIVVMDSRLDFVTRCVEPAKRLHTGAPLDPRENGLECGRLDCPGVGDCRN